MRHLYRSFIFSVQSQIEFDDVDARLAQKAEVAAVGVLIDEFFQVVFTHVAGFRHAGNLQQRVFDADMGIKTAGGGLDGVGGNGLIIRKIICLAIIGDALLDGIMQRLRGRAIITAARAGGIITGAGGRGPWSEVFIRAESLTEEGGSDGLAIAVQNKTAIGLFWKEQLSGSKDNERVDTAADDHEDQRDDDRCFDFFENAHGDGIR